METYETLIETLTGVVERANGRRLAAAAERAAGLLKALDKRNHDPDDVDEYIRGYREAFDEGPSARSIAKTTTSLLRYLEKSQGLVPPSHYQSQWMAVGMAAFGLPIGAAIGTALGNMAFVGIGLPLGLAIGLSVGASKDKQADREGRQLDMHAE